MANKDNPKKKWEGLTMKEVHINKHMTKCSMESIITAYASHWDARPRL